MLLFKTKFLSYRFLFHLTLLSYAFILGSNIAQADPGSDAAKPKSYKVEASTNPTQGAVNPHLDKWPEEAVTYLKQLPDQRLELNFVVMKALADADVFKLHKADYLRGYASYLATLAAEDFRIQTGFNYIDERIEPVIPQFMATATQGWNAQLGFEKLLVSTGTSVKGGFTHSSQRLNFLSIPDFEYRESRFTLGIDQNLLSDFGGKGYKNLKKASMKASKANEFLVLGKIEDSILEIVSFYYNAWLKQRVLENLKESFQRRQTLNSILQRQKQNGLIESSDALQVEGLVLNNQAEVVINQQELQTMWEQLVIQLKLPESFMEVPAEEIPIGLDAPEVEANQACTNLDFAGIQKLSSNYNQAENLIASAERKIESLKPQLLPDLRFQANFTANGINSSPSETWRELRDLENPGMNLGLALNFPIQNS